VTTVSGSPIPPVADAATERLAALVQELLDAHCDTLCLADDAGAGEEVAWDAHLDYLRALQRVGQRALAEVTAQGRPAAAPERSYGAGALGARSASS